MQDIAPQMQDNADPSSEKPGACCSYRVQPSLPAGDSISAEVTKENSSPGDSRESGRLYPAEITALIFQEFTQNLLLCVRLRWTEEVGDMR
ncbi:hypothetical protein [Gimesia maris]|uniref:hypothetical protein n=1 Tax=Gimesia maris TaxID=122 RepID=UPI003A8D89A9